MTPPTPRRTQDTFTYRRMVWPYVLTTHPDGAVEVEVRDAICPRCRAKATYSKVGDSIKLQCRRCNISENYSPFSSYEELKAHVAGLVREKVGA